VVLPGALTGRGSRERSARSSPAPLHDEGPPGRNGGPSRREEGRGSGAERELAALGLAAGGDLASELEPLVRAVHVVGDGVALLAVEGLVDEPGVLLAQVVQLRALAGAEPLTTRDTPRAPRVVLFTAVVLGGVWAAEAAEAMLPAPPMARATVARAANDLTVRRCMEGLLAVWGVG
jgi:hypothetical protein